MDDHPSPRGVLPGPAAPITEADLHAFADGQLAPERVGAVERYLASHPDEAARVDDWRRQNALLHALLDPVADEPLPVRLPLALPPARRGWATLGAGGPWRALAAGLAIALLSGGAAWSLRGHLDAEAMRLALALPAGAGPGTADTLTGFARRAAVAHVVYSPDVRRPVEVGADQEQALVTWLTKRMGTAIKPPALGALGYELIGGRLLPGERGPVAQFMYGDAAGQRLTLYVTHQPDASTDTAFRFGQDGPVNVFWWVEDGFGYALSAGAGRTELLRVSEAIYRQLKRG